MCSYLRTTLSNEGVALMEMKCGDHNRHQRVAGERDSSLETHRGSERQTIETADRRRRQTERGSRRLPHTPFRYSSSRWPCFGLPLSSFVIMGRGEASGPGEDHGPHEEKVRPPCVPCVAVYPAVVTAIRAGARARRIACLIRNPKSENQGCEN